MIREESSLVYLSFNLEARGAEVAPPLSTVIGNEGLNAKSFCDDFNILTADLPLYFKLKVFLMIDKSNRKWRMILGKMSSSFLMQLVSYPSSILVQSSGGLKSIEIFCVDLKALYYISLFCFNNTKVSNIVSLVATARSCGYYLKV